MSPEDMPIVEASAHSRFLNRDKLLAHVIKHVIEGRDERWQNLIDEQLLAAARSEYRSGVQGPQLAALASRYQALVSQLLHQVCLQRRAHQHACSFRWNLEDRTREALAQLIDAWPESEKMLISAAAFVKGRQVGPYRILTAFRPWPKISLNGHKRKARERQRNLESLFPRRILEIHDD